MTKRKFGVCFVSIMVLIAVSFGLVASPATYAQGPGGTPVKHTPVPGGITKQYQGAELADGIINPPLTGPITAVVVLEGAAAGEVRGNFGAPESPAANQAGMNRVQELRAAQASLSANLAANFNIQTVAHLVNLTNGLVVNMDASQIDAVKALPGVADVVPDQIGYLDNGNSVPFIGAPAAWLYGAGYTGAGIRIGIIDSGVDYTHANFGGSGDPAVYATNMTGDNDMIVTDNVGGDAVGFDNSKVVGGYDFVGSGWTGGAPLTRVAPATGIPRVPGGWAGAPFTIGDDDPIDCNGHGSHVAGTAAGFGVDGAGTTYAGPYPPADFGAMIIGPGVAPEAEIYAFKIGDCSSSVSFAAALVALDMVVDPNGDGNMADHMDVTNSSYGGAYGTPAELLTQAFNAASLNGVVMVGSAGNEGDTFFIHGDPNVAARGISVASGTNDTVAGGLQLDQGNASYPAYPTVIPAHPSQSGAVGVFGSFQLRMVGGGINNQGCNVADFAGFAGEAGLIVWDDSPSGCGSATRMTNAVNALAVNGGDVRGLVVVSADPGDFPFINLSCAYNGGPSPIPCVSVTNADGQLLAANPGDFFVTFDSSLAVPLGGIGDMLSGFSSRGPSMGAGLRDMILKPDITAPGDAITSTNAGTGNGPLTIGGTSMAAPHITGAVALLRQQHPAWTVEQIKAVIMNTATHDLWTDPGQTGNNYGVSRIGAGRVDIGNAVRTNVIAYHSIYPERVSVSYGLVEVVGTFTGAETITLRNFGQSPETFNVSFDTLNDLSGVNFTVSPAQITVPAGGTTTVTVTLNANVATMNSPYALDPTTSPTQPGVWGNLPRNWLAEEGGYITLVSTGRSPTLRVPVHAVVRPAADMLGDATFLADDPTGIGAGQINLTGIGVDTGFNVPFDIVSQVTAFELVYDNPTPLGTYEDSAVIRYLGIASDYLYYLNGPCAGDANCAAAAATIYVAVATHANWDTAIGYFDTTFDIGFDTNNDGTVDYTLFNFDTGYIGGADFNDVIMSWLAQGDSWLFGSGSLYSAMFMNEWPADMLTTYLHANNVMVFPVAAANLGLTGADTNFSINANTYKHGVDVDVVPWLAPFDIANPTYSFTGGYAGIPMWYDLDGYAVPVDYNITAWGEGPYPSILLIHHHNAGANARPQVIPVTTVYVPPAGDDDDDVVVPGEPGTVTAGEPGAPIVLPSTGYAPEEDTSSTNNVVWVIVIGSLALTIAGGVILRRRTRD